MSKPESIGILFWLCFCFQWVFPKTIKSLLLVWHGTRMKTMASLCLFRCIWKEQNSRNFKEEEHPGQVFKELFLKTFFDQASKVWSFLEGFKCRFSSRTSCIGVLQLWYFFFALTFSIHSQCTMVMALFLSSTFDQCLCLPFNKK